MLFFDRSPEGEASGGGGTAGTPAGNSSAGDGSTGGGGTGQSADATGTVPGEGSAAGTALPPYTPNFKFKYAVDGEKQQEGEFDDLFKPLIKDAETEKKVRELFAKAHGLDFIKSDRDRIKGEYDPLVEKHTSITNSLSQLSGFVRQGDFQSFFEALQIPEQAVLKYALERVQYHKMDPAQRAQLDEHRRQTTQAMALQQQNEQLQTQMRQLSATQRATELDTTLGRPDIAAHIQNFDTRAGKPGAFRDLVIQRGQYYALAQGVDMPPAQVVADVLAMIGAQVTAGGQAQGNGAAPPSTNGQRPPVLPNVSGKGTSPAKRTYTSTDDLRKRAAQLAASE